MQGSTVVEMVELLLSRARWSLKYNEMAKIKGNGAEIIHREVLKDEQMV